MKIGARVYYEIATGNVILNTGHRSGAVVPTTIDQDISSYKVLTDRNVGTFDVIELDYGQYSQDFAECVGYRVNPETQELEFSYPDPNEPNEPQPYQPPISEEVAKLKQEKTMLELQVNTLSDRSDFLEDVMTEIILTVVE